MAEIIFDYYKFQREYGEITIQVIKNCVAHIDESVKQILEKMISQDWIAAWFISDRFLVAAGYLKARQFFETSKNFHNFVGEHREYKSRNDIENPYILKESFNDQMKLQAYEYFYLLIDEARILMFETSKYTKQQIPENIYLEEVKKIKQLHQELKESLEKQKVQQIVKQTNEVIDRPRNNFCNDKCNIY